MGRRLLTLLLAAAIGLAVVGSALAAYPWPVRPFDRQHPIRANFGDPRTVFKLPLFADGIDGPGAFSFHNGVDISAPNGTRVYPVVSGIAHLIDGAAIAVVTVDDRTFQYFHVIPTIVDGERVTARQTVLGYVQSPYEHVHLSEIDGFRVTNPLRKGHLTPYTDRTRPRVDEIDIRDEQGHLAGPLGVCGRVSIAAAAFDRPSRPVPGSFSGLPIAPALVTWKLARLGGHVVVPTTAAADFRTGLPAPVDFWDVYARGSYQNAPRFANQQFGSMPGRFLFLLAPAFDTRAVPNGVYLLTASATDERQNSGGLVERFSILNVKTPSGCPDPPPASPPEQPPPPQDPGPPPAP